MAASLRDTGSLAQESDPQLQDVPAEQDLAEDWKRIAEKGRKAIEAYRLDVEEEQRNKVRRDIHLKTAADQRQFVDSEVSKWVLAQLRADLKKEVTAELKEEVMEQLVTDVRRENEAALKLKLKAELRVQLAKELRVTLAASLEPEIKKQLAKQLEGEVRQQLRKDLTPNLEADIRATLTPKVEESLRKEYAFKPKQQERARTDRGCSPIKPKIGAATLMLVPAPGVPNTFAASSPNRKRFGPDDDYEQSAKRRRSSYDYDGHHKAYRSAGVIHAAVNASKSTTVPTIPVTVDQSVEESTTSSTRSEGVEEHATSMEGDTLVEVDVTYIREMVESDATSPEVEETGGTIEAAKDDDKIEKALTPTATSSPTEEASSGTQIVDNQEDLAQIVEANPTPLQSEEISNTTEADTTAVDEDVTPFISYDFEEASSDEDPTQIPEQSSTPNAVVESPKDFAIREDTPEIVEEVKVESSTEHHQQQALKRQHDDNDDNNEYERRRTSMGVQNEVQWTSYTNHNETRADDDMADAYDYNDAAMADDEANEPFSPCYEPPEFLSPSPPLTHAIEMAEDLPTHENRDEDMDAASTSSDGSVYNTKSGQRPPEPVSVHGSDSEDNDMRPVYTSRPEACQKLSNEDAMFLLEDTESELNFYSSSDEDSDNDEFEFEEREVFDRNRHDRDLSAGVDELQGFSAGIEDMVSYERLAAEKCAAAKSAAATESARAERARAEIEAKRAAAVAERLALGNAGGLSDFEEDDEGMGVGEGDRTLFAMRTEMQAPKAVDERMELELATKEDVMASVEVEMDAPKAKTAVYLNKCTWP